MPASSFLTGAAWVFLGAGLAVAVVVIVRIYLLGYREHMKVMEAVWPLTALYGGPLALAAYVRWRRPMLGGAMPAERRPRAHGMPAKPLWAGVAVSATHCGAGCVLGDLIAEWVVFAAGLKVAGMTLSAEYLLDYVLALGWGILFQYFAIAPMRRLPPGEGLRRAAKADFLALTAFEAGLFGWMAIVQLVIFPAPHLPVDTAAFWFLMQVGMLVGLVTTFPVNWWLIRRGIKEAM
ncbi:MAG: DUF4396 domain-containing protein [Actinobacteria bacterium]|nr:DUF4396 domain-containing protein [Actinomycetota bacterium]